MRRVFRGGRAQRDDAIVARTLTLSPQAPLRHPYQWMEPVQGADESRHRLGKRVFARDVRELVPQDYSAMFLRPFERAFRQQNHRRDRSPGERSGGHGTAEEIHFARDACLRARVGKKHLPVRAAERPRFARDAAQLNAPNNEPADDHAEAEHPDQ